MCSFIASGLKIKDKAQSGTLGPNQVCLIIKGGLKIKGCKLEVLYGLIHVIRLNCSVGRIITDSLI